MKKNKMLKIVGVLFLSLVIFFVGLFFFLTSNFFLAKVVIPQVSKTTGIPIKIEKISLSLFSGEIEIDKLMLGDTDDLRLSAEKIFLKTEILPLLSNKIVLDELKISNVKTSLIVDKNGKLKLPETKTISPKSKENKKTSTTALPKLNIRKIQINDVSIALIIEQNENPLKIIAENFSIKLNDLKNDGKKMFSFEFLSALKVTNADSLDINSKQIKITSKGILQEDFLPKELELEASLPFTGKVDKRKFKDTEFKINTTLTKKDDSLYLAQCELKQFINNKNFFIMKLLGDIKEEPFSANLSLSSGINWAEQLHILETTEQILSIADINGKTQTNIKINEDYDISVEGDLSFDFLQLISSSSKHITSHPGNDLKEMQPTRFPIHADSKYKLKYSQKDSFLKVETFGIAIKKDNRPFIMLGLHNPFNISFNDKLSISDTKLNLSFAPIKLTFLKHFLGSDIPVDLQKTSISGKIDITSNMKKQTITASGKVMSHTFLLADYNLPLFLEIKESIEFSPFQKKIRINKFETNLQSKGLELKLTIADSAKINLDPMQISLPYEIKVPKTNISVFKTFIPPESLVVNSGIISANIRGNVHYPQNIIGVKTTIALDALSVLLPDAKSPTKPLKLILDSELSANEKLIKLKKTDINVFEVNTSKSLLSCKINGKIIPTLDKPGTDLSILFDETIDLEKIEKLIPQFKETKAKKQIAKNPPKTSKESSSTKIFLKSNLNIKRVLYKDIDINNLSANMNLEGQQMSLNPLLCTINKGIIKLYGKTVLPQKNTDKLTYNLNFSGSNLDLTPIVKSLSPEAGKYFKGGLQSLQTKITGQGTEIDDLKEILTAEFKTKINSLKINLSVIDLLNKGNKAIPLAPILKTMIMNQLGKGVQNLDFVGGNANIAVNNGKIYLKELNLLNPRLKFSTQGTVDIGGEWQPNLKISSAVKGSLAKRMAGKISNTADKNGYYDFKTLKISTWDYKKLLMNNTAEMLESSGIIKSKDKEAVNAILDIGKSLGVLGEEKKKDKSANKKIKIDLNKALQLFNQHQNKKSKKKQNKNKKSEKENQQEQLKGLIKSFF